MYSHEIEEYLKLKNYLLEVQEYINIINNSPQITHIKYNPFNNEFELNTSDNYSFKIKIYRRKI